MPALIRNAFALSYCLLRPRIPAMTRLNKPAMQQVLPKVMTITVGLGC